jgi:hypothetical protein
VDNLLITGILIGVVGFDMAQRILDRKALKKAEGEAKENAAKLAELHNNHVKILADLTEKVNGHDFYLKSVQSDKVNTSLKRF